MSFSSIYIKQRFNPNLISILINPFYFIRRGLYKEIRYLSSALSGRLLDFGCGSKPYKELFKVDEYIGLDIENRGHPHANEEIDIFYDGKSIPFNNNYFDSIFSTEVFEHVDNLDTIIIEIKRVLKPDGKLLITIPFVWLEHELPYDFRRLTTTGICHLLERNGFSILEARKTTTDTETTFQTIAMYIYSYFGNQSVPFKILLNVLFIFPFTLLGILFSTIMPNKKLFYNNTVILAKKSK